MDPGVVSAVDSGMGSGWDSKVESGVDAPLDSGVVSGVRSGVDAGVHCGMDSGVDSGMNPGVDSEGDKLGSKLYDGLSWTLKRKMFIFHWFYKHFRNSRVDSGGIEDEPQTENVDFPLVL